MCVCVVWGIVCVCLGGVDVYVCVWAGGVGVCVWGGLRVGHAHISKGGGARVENAYNVYGREGVGLKCFYKSMVFSALTAAACCLSSVY